MSESHSSNRVLIICVQLALALSVLNIFLMTVEYDEAWILSAAQEIGNPESIPSVTPVFTTGGIFTLSVRFLSATGIPIHILGRLFSLLCFCGLLFLLYKFTWEWFASNTERLIVLTVAVAAPASIVLGSMSYGVMTATVCFFVGVYAWITLPERSSKRWLITGLAIGFAAATRATYVPLVPAIFLWSLTSREKRRNHLVDSLMATSLAGGLFLSSISLHVYMSSTSHPESFAGVLKMYFESTGAGGDPTKLPSILSFLVKGTLFMPLPIFLVCGYLSWFGGSSESSKERNFLQILTLSSAILFAFWIVRSPFQHVRYVWPAVFFSYATLGIYVAHLYAWIRAYHANSRAYLLCLIGPLGLAAASFVAAIRLIGLGAAMQTNSAGLESLENHFKLFYLIQEQNAMVRYLDEQIDEEAIVAALHLPAEWSELQLSLLSQKRIHRFNEWNKVGIEPSILLYHRFSAVSEEGLTWLDRKCDQIIQLRGYRVCYLGDAASQVAEVDFQLDTELNRFTLPKVLSLSGY